MTGIGVISPNGIGVAEYWAATLRGTSGITRISRFDPSGYSAQLAGEVTIDAKQYLPSRLLPQTDHMTRLALIAAEEALREAGADPARLPEYSAGVVTGASAGGFEFGQKELAALWSKGGRYVSAYQSFAWFYPVNSGQISIRHAMRGASSTLVAEQAGGLDALAKARRHIRDDTRFMLAGAVDGSLCPWAWLCLIRSGRLSTHLDPARGFLPFDSAANGVVPGEGGALLVLEEPDHAAERDAAMIYGRISGHASTFDRHSSRANGSSLRRAITLALADAETTADDIDVVFADGAGLPELDRIEAEAIASVFGKRGVPVTVPKTMTGRLLAGGGALDVATALLAIRDGVIPPTVHVDSPAFPAELDLVSGEPRQAELTSALVLARGYGGFNSALVVQR